MALKRTQTAEQMIRQGLKSSLIGIAMNLVLALCKCVAGFLGHSFALVADGIESTSDVVSSSVVYFGLKFAIKPPDKEHPYGHSKAEPIAAIIVSLALILAAIVIGAESIQRIRTPHRLPESYTLWVLLTVVGIKVLLSRYVSSVGKNIDSTAVRSDAWHHLSDAITSGFAFVGIGIAFGAETLPQMTGRHSVLRLLSSSTLTANCGFLSANCSTPHPHLRSNNRFVR